MKKSFVQKAAAVACSAATIAAMSIAAISASAAGANEIVADQIYAKAGDKKVVYTVKLKGTDAQFNQCNFTLKYDSRLKPYVDEEAPNKPEFKTDYSGMATVMINTDQKVVGYGFVADGKLKKNESNSLLQIYFDVPEDAKAGDTYDITFLDEKSKVLLDKENLTVENQAGWIKIAPETTTSTTETTTSTSETTTTTKSETTAASTAESTAASTDSTAASTDSTASGTGTGTTASGTGTGTTASGTGTGTTASGTGAAGSSASSSKNTQAPQKTNAPSTQKTQTTGDGKKDAPKTGDAGVALALAGLLAAAGTAVAIRKKH